MSALGNESAPGQGQAGNEQRQEAEFDFAKGYQELRPEYTRVTQELSTTNERLSEYEQLFAALHDPDPETQRAAMDALGLELDTGTQGSTDTDEFVDPLEEQLAAANARLEALEQQREQEASAREDEQLTAMRDDYIGEAITYIEANALPKGQKFTQREEEVLGNLAIAMEDEQGVPDVQGAYNYLYGDDGVLEINRQRWIDTKRSAAQAPTLNALPAEQRPQTAADRIHYIDERMRASEQDY
jgi:hypothetical protein